MLQSRTAAALSTALELVFPGNCLLCGGGLAGRCRPFFPVCQHCLSALVPLDAPSRCRICSMPLISEARVCTRCRQRNFDFAGNHSLFEYRGTIRELIFQFKFKRHRRAALVLADLLGGACRERFGTLPLVPVPGHPRGVRARGWEPMREVSRALAGMYGLAVLDVLRRRGSREQKALSFEERVANVRGSIVLRPRSSAVPGELLLIDDIFTTGATASECARLLRQAGARRVEVLTLAID